MTGKARRKNEEDNIFYIYFLPFGGALWDTKVHCRAPFIVELCHHKGRHSQCLSSSISTHHALPCFRCSRETLMTTHQRRTNSRSRWWHASCDSTPSAGTTSSPCVSNWRDVASVSRTIFNLRVVVNGLGRAMAHDKGWVKSEPKRWDCFFKINVMTFSFDVDVSRLLIVNPFSRITLLHWTHRCMLNAFTQTS